ncbi:hypothetical protein H0H92_015685, partial [Tricholoma furcatifolium]
PIKEKRKRGKGKGKEKEQQEDQEQQEEQQEDKEKGKRRRAPRPPQAMLSFSEAVRLFGRKNIFHPFDVSDDSPIVDDYFQIVLEDNSCLIYHGLLLSTTLDFEFAQPTDGELEFFYSFSAFQWLQKDPDCQVGLVNLAASRLQSGNEVEVVGDGEPLKGMTGVVQSVERDVATVFVESSALRQGVEIPLLSLRAVYQRGQYVK